jgi:hypothetical protein
MECVPLIDFREIVDRLVRVELDVQTAAAIYAESVVTARWITLGAGEGERKGVVVVRTAVTPRGVTLDGDWKSVDVPGESIIEIRGFYDVTQRAIYANW